MFRALLLVVTVVALLAVGLLLTLSPRVDYGAFTTSCPGILAAGDGSTAATGGDVPAGIEIVHGRAAFDRQEVTERNTGVRGADRVGRRLAADCADRRYTWSLGAGAAALLGLASGTGLLLHARDRRASRVPEGSAR